MKIYILFCLAFTTFFACKEKDTPIEPTPSFSVAHDEETMPVWIHGKADSKFIILAVHGGPGSDALDFRTYKNGTGFKKIEDNFLVAYWQQRASGQSKGSNDTKYFTIEQYVEDADMVIDALKKRYPEKKIVLFGHSWGGMLTSSYLKDANRKAKVAAWINAAGAHNGTTFSQTTINDLNTEADKRIKANDNVVYWQDIKTQIKNNPSKANSLAYAVIDKISEVPIKVNNADFPFMNRASLSNGSLFSQVVKTDNTPALANFNLPTLVLWGEYDFAVSKTLRDEVYSKITQNITKVHFLASGHYMMFHEPELFSKSMTDFINRL